MTSNIKHTYLPAISESEITVFKMFISSSVKGIDKSRKCLIFEPTIIALKNL